MGSNSPRAALVRRRSNGRQRALCSLLLLLAGCATSTNVDPLLANVPAASTQVVVVRPHTAGSIQAAVTGHERTPQGWRCVLGPLPAVVGRTGVIAGEQKREGDGHTPAGVYPFGVAFGYAPTLATGLRYRQATGDDYWVDESTSPHYNQWVTGRPAVSAEQMRRDDDQYAMGAVLEYNTRPVVPGRGSAIFLHVWKGPAEPTSGCVALSAGDVQNLLQWLQADRKPVVVIGLQ